MSNIDVNQVLSQMRTMAAQAQGSVSRTAEDNGGGDFAALFKQSIDSVNETQKEAGRLSEAFERGDKTTDLTQVMVALQKANVSFQAMTQVRNKLVDAYKDVMNMPM